MTTSLRCAGGDGPGAQLRTVPSQCNPRRPAAFEPVLSPRSFIGQAPIGLGTAGLIGSSFIIGRGREAAAFEPAGSTLLLDDDVLKISSNENARGREPNVMRAIQEAVTPRLGRGYPPDYTADLLDSVAAYNGVAPENVVFGTGSGALLGPPTPLESLRRSCGR